MQPCALGIVFQKNKTEVLLVKRKDVPIWVIPGGGIDPYESPEQAVVRELKEETGYSVLIKEKIAEYTPKNNLAKEVHLFLCEIYAGNSFLNDEASEIAFFPLSSLPNLFFLHHHWLQDALQFNGTLIQKPIEGIACGAFFKYFFRHPIICLKYLWTRIKNGKLAKAFLG